MPTDLTDRPLVQSRPDSECQPAEMQFGSAEARHQHRWNHGFGLRRRWGISTSWLPMARRRRGESSRPRVRSFARGARRWHVPGRVESLEAAGQVVLEGAPGPRSGPSTIDRGQAGRSWRRDRRRGLVNVDFINHSTPGPAHVVGRVTSTRLAKRQAPRDVPCCRSRPGRISSWRDCPENSQTPRLLTVGLHFRSQAGRSRLPGIGPLIWRLAGASATVAWTARARNRTHQSWWGVSLRGILGGGSADSRRSVLACRRSEAADQRSRNVSRSRRGVGPGGPDARPEGCVQSLPSERRDRSRRCSGSTKKRRG
jgi:hypothetical protein